MAEIYPAGIRYTSNVSFDDDFDAYFVKIEGELLCYEGSEIDVEVVAGRIEAYYIDVIGAESHGFSTFDLFDQLQEAFDCYRLMYDVEMDDLAESFLQEFGDASQPNVLLLHRLEVLSPFRGAKLGLAAINRTIDLWGHGCGYAVLLPAPLQAQPAYSLGDQRWREAMALDKFTPDIEAACDRLAAYYALLGFRPVPNSEWMALNLDFERPSLEEIGFESN